ncbi:AI-2E family transporter [bacterium]|nr:AI-2E family transporter [bacterium]
MENVKILSIKNIITFMIIVAVIVLSIYSLDILMMLFGSFVITCAISPIINKMEKRIPRVWCVTILLFAMILASFLIIVPLITISAKEAIQLIGNFPNIIDNIEKFLSFQVFGKSLASYITFESIKEPLTQGAQQIIGNSLVAGKWVANFFTTLFAIAIMVFYFAYDEKRLKDKFIEFFPIEHKQRALCIFDNIASKVGNYVFAQGIAMVFVGTITAIGLWALGLLFHTETHALLLGFLTCIFDIIPVVGPAIAIAIGLISNVDGGIILVLSVFAVYMIAQWSQNQILRPIVFGKLLNMHPLMIIIALLIAARFLGFWGVVLSPAIACAICVLVDELYLNKINNRE